MRWTAFRSHYGFDAFYCHPGQEGAHEKGGVEGEGGRFRRNHCVPMPKVDSIEELNVLLAAADAKDDHRRIENRSQTVGHDFVFERETGRPLFDIEERPVPASTVPGEHASPTQPFPVKPPPFSHQGFGEDDVTDLSPAAKSAVHERLKKFGFTTVFTPPSLKGTLSNPGTLGGANWSGASFDPATGLLYVNANQLPRLLRLEATNTPDRPYLEKGEVRILDPDGYPAIKPPWGTLTAIDLNQGEIKWQVPLGEFPELTQRGIKPTGARNLGGSIVTAGGIVFIGATVDRQFRAFDSATGRVLWTHELPFAGHAAPSTYTVAGRQYDVIAAGGGGKLATPAGDVYVAFALPKND